MHAQGVLRRYNPEQDMANGIVNKPVPKYAFNKFNVVYISHISKKMRFLIIFKKTIP